MKKTLATLLVLAFMAGAALAAEPVKPTLVFYWVTGQLSGPAIDYTNCNVIVYAADKSKAITAVPSADGKFIFNLGELYYYNDQPFDFATAYYIEVPPFEVEGQSLYAPATALTIDPNSGFIMQNLTLQFLNIPAGTVPLTITRDGTNIKISWDAIYSAGGNPQLFVLTGNGDGNYTETYITVPTPNWLSIVGNTEFETHFADNYVLHKNQVGASYAEAYYKGLQAGVDPAGDSPTAGKKYLETAWGVGKITAEVVVGWNIISLPLLQPSGGLDQTLGTAGFVDNEQVLVWDRVNQQFLVPAANFGSGTWGSVINPQNGEGYGIHIVSVPPGQTKKTITIIGNVQTLDYSGQFEVNWNQIGFPFPYAASLNNGSGLSLGKANVNDQLLEWDKENQKFLVPASTFNGTQWSLDTKLKPGIGYGYNRVNNQLLWSVPKQ